MEPAPEESKLDRVIETIKQLRIEPFLFFYMFSVSIRDVTLQTVIMERACWQNLNYSKENCSDIDNDKNLKNEVQSIALNYRIALMLISSIPAAFTATFLSPWSDKYGRKIPLIVAVVGNILEGIGTMIVVKISSAPLYLLLLTHIPSGIFGGFLMAISSSLTYLSDVTTPESRAVRYAILEFVFVLASPLAIAIGGQIYKYSGAMPVLIIAIVAQAASIIWAVMVVKETRGLNEKKNLKIMISNLFTFKNLKETIRSCTIKRPGTIRAQIWIMILSMSISIFCMMGSVSIGYMFANAMYDWDNPKYSTVSAVASFFRGAAMLISIPIFTKVLTMPESMIAMIGVLSAGADSCIKIAAYQEWMYYYACFMGILSGITGVAVRSRLSKMVSRDDISKVFSLLALCEASTPGIAVFVFGTLYKVTLRTFPGASYLLTTLLLLIAAACFAWIKKQGPPPTSHELSEGGYRMESFAEE